jgi:hypothetical protein
MLTNKQIDSIVETTIKDFQGDVRVLQGAIGALYVGKQFGWKAMYLMNDRRTIKKYENALDVSFQAELPEIGPLAQKSVAVKALKKVSNFWKAVRGEISNVRSPQVS